MTTNILCPIDFKHESMSAEAVAMRLATAMHGVVTFLNIEEGYEKVAATLGHTVIATNMPELRKGLLEAAGERLQKHINNAANKLSVTSPYLTRVASGQAIEKINAIVSEKPDKPELIVLGKKRRTFLHDFFLGSVAQSLLDSGSLPILLVPDHPQYEQWIPKQIILGTDLTKKNARSIQWSCRMAKLCYGNVKILHVAEPFQALVPPEVPGLYYGEIEAIREAQCNAMLKEEEMRCDLEKNRVSSELLIGTPAEALSRYMSAEKDALLVLETHRHKNHVGRLASSIARSAAFPVLFVPQ